MVKITQKNVFECLHEYQQKVRTDNQLKSNRINIMESGLWRWRKIRNSRVQSILYSWLKRYVSIFKMTASSSMDHFGTYVHYTYIDTHKSSLIQVTLPNPFLFCRNPKINQNTTRYAFSDKNRNRPFSYMDWPVYPENFDGKTWNLKQWLIMTPSSIVNCYVEVGKCSYLSKQCVKVWQAFKMAKKFWTVNPISNIWAHIFGIFNSEIKWFSVKVLKQLLMVKKII